MAVMEAKASQIEEALRLRSEGARLHEAAGLNPASAEVERLVTIAEGLTDLPAPGLDLAARSHTRRLFAEEAAGYRTAWVHNHSVAHRRSRHPGRRHPFRWGLVVALATLLALFTGVGVALAAQLSDPDTALYPVRIASEKGLLYVTRKPLDKAAIHVDFANQRFRDAESMAAKGKAQQTLDSLSSYYDELRVATNLLGAEKVRGKGWRDVRNQLADAEAKKIDIVETALVTSGRKEAATVVAQRQKAFNVERQALDKQLTVEAPKPAAPAPVTTPPPG